MKNLLKIGHGVDVIPLLLAIQRQPNLWNRHARRKEFEGTSHAQTSDIWLRFRDEKPFKESGDWAGFDDEHDAIWYPEWYALQQAKPIVFGLMARVEGVRLGGVMITKIPPGGRVLPHADAGWHAKYYNTKLYVPLQSSPQCINRVGDEHVAMAPGEIWYFDNTVEHEVINDGPDDRITLIVCIRCEK